MITINVINVELLNLVRRCSQGGQTRQAAQGHKATIDLALIRTECAFHRVPLSCIYHPYLLFPPSFICVLAQSVLSCSVS